MKLFIGSTSEKIDEIEREWNDTICLHKKYGEKITMPKKSINRPSNQELAKLIENYSLRQIAAMFKVSHNAVFLWARAINEPEKPKKTWKHGTSTGYYNYLCKCEACRMAGHEVYLKRKANKKK